MRRSSTGTLPFLRKRRLHEAKQPERTRRPFLPTQPAGVAVRPRRTVAKHNNGWLQAWARLRRFPNSWWGAQRCDCISLTRAHAVPFKVWQPERHAGSRTAERQQRKENENACAFLHSCHDAPPPQGLAGFAAPAPTPGLQDGPSGMRQPPQVDLATAVSMDLGCCGTRSLISGRWGVVACSPQTSTGPSARP